jgi:acetate kinase
MRTKGKPHRLPRICDGLGFLGIELEQERNATNEGAICATVGRVALRVIRTEVMIGKNGLPRSRAWLKKGN